MRAHDNGPLRGYKLDQRRRGLLDSTIARRERSLRTFQQWLEPKPITEATTEEVERFLDGRNLSAKGRYCWLSILHSFFEWAVRVEATDHDPTAVIQRPKLRKRLPRPATDQDILYAIENTAEKDLRAWIAFGAFAGLRCMEIAGMDHDAIVDHGSGPVVTVLGKGEKERAVPAHPFVLQAVERYGVPRTGRMFVRPDGRPWTAAQVSQRANLHLKRLGLNFTMHQLRHWFGTRTYANEKDLRVTQELMGHSSPTTTAVYTEFSKPDASKAVLGLTLARFEPLGHVPPDETRIYLS